MLKSMQNRSYIYTVMLPDSDYYNYHTNIDFIIKLLILIEQQHSLYNVRGIKVMLVVCADAVETHIKYQNRHHHYHRSNVNCFRDLYYQFKLIQKALLILCVRVCVIFYEAHNLATP